eukprot:6776048-Prorocentrum_lima.AAC.1
MTLAVPPARLPVVRLELRRNEVDGGLPDLVREVAEVLFHAFLTHRGIAYCGERFAMAEEAPTAMMSTS